MTPESFVRLADRNFAENLRDVGPEGCTRSTLVIGFDDRPPMRFHALGGWVERAKVRILCVDRSGRRKWNQYITREMLAHVDSIQVLPGE